MPFVNGPSLRPKRDLSIDDLLAVQQGRRPADPDITFAPETISSSPVESAESAPVIEPDIVKAFLYSESGEPVKNAKQKIPISSPPEYDGAKEIEGLLAQLEKSQNNDRQLNKLSRIQAWNTMAGSAVSSGMGGLKENHVEMPDRIKEGAQVKERAELGDKLKNSKANREFLGTKKDLNVQKYSSGAIDLDNKGNLNNPLSGESKYIHDTWKAVYGFDAPEGLSGADLMEARPDFKQHMINKHQKAKLDQDESQFTRGETGKLERTKIGAAAMLGGKAMGINAAAGQGGSRAIAENAKNQSERQIAGWDDTAPHTATDETKGAHIAGSEAAIQSVGRKAVDIMRRNGPNFPKSTEWRKLESTMNTLHEEFNKAHENGVMNFGDKDNRVVEVGDPQSFGQFALQNGPDVLEHALDNMAMSVDAKMATLKYRRNKDWKAKSLEDYLGAYGSGGGMLRGGVDPNVVGGVIDSALSGGRKPMPKFNNPSDDVRGSKGASSEWNPDGPPAGGIQKFVNKAGEERYERVK